MNNFETANKFFLPIEIMIRALMKVASRGRKIKNATRGKNEQSVIVELNECQIGVR